LTYYVYRQGTIPITDGKGQHIRPEMFLSLFNPPSSSTAETPPLKGACLRWAIGMDKDKTPVFEIQGLPTPAANIQKKFFNGDNAVSVLLGAFRLSADMFDGTFANGFVPIFFSDNPAAAQTHLNRNPNAVKEAVMAANSRLLHMEHLTLPEAVAHLNAKKGRMAKGTAAFPASSSRKRGRPGNTSISGSGT
jgi:hypothetical protein